MTPLQEAPVPERTVTVNVYETQHRMLQAIATRETEKQGRPVKLPEVIGLLIRAYWEAQK